MKKKAQKNRASQRRGNGSKADEPLRVLILEDNTADAELMERQLRRDGIAFVARRADSRAAFLRALKEFRPDVLLADFNLPKFDALRALELAKKEFPFLPFIVVTGSIGEEQAVACLRAGADDYVLKDRLARLGEAVRHALAHLRLESEKIAVDQALRLAATQWRTTFDSMNDAVCLLDANGAILRCNRAMNRLLGLPFAKTIGRDCLDLVCGRKKRASCGFRLLRRDNRSHEEETFWRSHWYQVRVDPIRDGKGKTIGAVHVMTDISRAKEMEAQLRESEKRFRSLYENATIGLYRTTPDGRILMANPALLEMLGYGTFAELSRRNLEKEGFEPDYPRRRFRSLLKRENRVVGIESAWKRRDGTTVFVREFAQAIRSPKGRVLYYDGTVEDISARKRAEAGREEALASLHEMNRIFQLFLVHSPTYVFIKDEDIRPVYLSANYETMLRRPLAEILGKTMDELFPSPMSRSMIADDKRILREGVPREFIEELDGRIYSTTKFPIFIKGKAKFLGGYTTDITEQKRAEQQLRESDRLLSNLSAQIPGMIYTFLRRPDGTYCVPFSSGAIRDIFGVAPHEVAGDAAPIFAAILAEDRDRVLATIEDSARSLAIWQCEYRVQLPGQPVRWLWGSSQPFAQADGGVLWYGFNADISERKRAEKMLRDSLEYLRIAQRAAKAGMWSWDVATGELTWSAELFQLFGIDPAAGASFANWLAALHPDDRDGAMARVSQAVEQHVELLNEYRIVRTDGEIRWIVAPGNTTYDEAGKPLRMSGICMDNTERKRVEELLHASLREKEILLKEIHHRVKNNLQVISGLLTLQAAQIDDPRLLRTIKDSQSRIWTMALIHQTLYQSGNLAAVDMADYIRSLAGNLLSSQAQVAMPPTVDFDLLPLRLAIDKAIPLALIVNELLTNAMKHAVSADHPGVIRVTLKKRAPAPGATPDECSYELAVADDGPGLPEGFDLSDLKSLGLQLVSMLAKQMNGSFSYASDKGAEFRLVFNTDEKKEM